MKKCFKCQQIKDITEFYRCKRDGYQSACKICKKSLKKVSDRDYFNRNRDRLLSDMKDYYHANKAHLRPKMRAYYQQYSKANRALCNARLAKYRTSKLQATPSWVNFSELQKIYLNCPKGMEVDHIIPLRGEKVCGLHVPWNLQYLTRSDNARKGNRLGKVG